MTTPDLAAIEDDWGCEYCRNDGRLFDGRCPKCDAEYFDEDGETNSETNDG